MRRILLTLIALCSMLAGAQAQMRSDALYVYRNDGEFNAFVYPEIQEITLSQVDTFGVSHDEVVVQEFHTPDSIYRIPISAIDSVSFVQPEIIFNKDVVQIADGDWRQWVKSVSGLTVTFRSNTPESLKPKKGQVLTYVNRDNLMEGSFIGRVATVTTTADGIVAQCTQITDLCEIFDQLVGVETDFGMTPQTRSIWENDFGLEIPVSAQLNFDFNDNFSINGGLEGKMAFKCVWNIGMFSKKAYFKFNAHLEAGISVTVTGKGKISSKDWDSNIFPKWSLPSVVFPACLPIFRLGNTLSPYTKAEATYEGSINLATPKYGMDLEIWFDNGNMGSSCKWITHNTPDNDKQIGTRFALKGSIHSGGKHEAKLGTWEMLNIADVSVETCVGPKISADFGIGVDWTKPEELLEGYSKFKDNKIDFTLLDVAFTGKGTFLGKEREFFQAEYSAVTQSFYFFPEFSEPDILSHNGTEVKVRSTPKNELLFPVKLGFMTKTMEGGKAVWSEPVWIESESYWLGYFWNDKNKMEASLPIRGSKMEIYPAFKFLGMTFPARPEAKFEKDSIAAPENFIKIEPEQMLTPGIHMETDFWFVGEDIEKEKPHHYSQDYGEGELYVSWKDAADSLKRVFTVHEEFLRSLGKDNSVVISYDRFIDGCGLKLNGTKKFDGSDGESEGTFSISCYPKFKVATAEQHMYWWQKMLGWREDDISGLGYDTFKNLMLDGSMLITVNGKYKASTNGTVTNIVFDSTEGSFTIDGNYFRGITNFMPNNGTFLFPKDLKQEPQTEEYTQNGSVSLHQELQF